MLSNLYGRAARFRRAWYSRHPERVRKLARPVISVGNLVVGGSGKTPAVSAIAQILLAAGERPAILSRGYGRRRTADGVVVVSDGLRVQVQAEESGDEPQMLAQTLAGVPVLVASDRYVGGVLAERRFNCTVHLLDDGFQHVQLARDVNLLMMSREDLDESPLPSGHLREPLDCAAAADALLIAGTDRDADEVSTRIGVTPVFRLLARQGAPRLLGDVHVAGPLRGTRPACCSPPGCRVVAVAGIARPRRFFDALTADGWEVARRIVFRDHHWFVRRDFDAIHQAAAEAGADLVVTTEKDAARLHAEDMARSPVPWAAVPLELSLEPSSFGPWLQERLEAARRRGAEAA